MKKNMGSVDRILRILLAIVIAGIYFENFITGTTAIILLILAGVFILTSFIGFCPIYIPFGISSGKKESKK